ncbi:MAG: RluA family pseudouridine synthase [Microcoleus sp. SU_5_3]|nr:RluA family pseudouridine synthase [Microcoleus sp. SU_5_3]
MLVLHALLDFTDGNWESIESGPTYWYQGQCPQSGEILRLPRTRMSEAIARGLMEYLAADDCYSREGKMYGVLLVEMPWGEKRILKAFSGLLNGCSILEGWAPPIPGRAQVAFEEARTLAQLDAIKQELIVLKQLPQRQQYEKLCCEFEGQLQVLSDRHRNNKQQRDQKRQLLSKNLAEKTLALALDKLDQESQFEGIERRQFKRNRDEILQPLKGLIEAADERIRELKQKRKELSRELQTQMHAAYTLVNFSGKSRSIQQLMPEGSMPTGTGDCCAPKLLHCAAVHNLKPLAMAEFWWGPSSGGKIQGEFYGACADRCQPLMGFLLSGLSQNQIVSNNDLEAEPPNIHSQALPGNDMGNNFACGTGKMPVLDEDFTGGLEAHPTNNDFACETGILPVADRRQMPPIIYEDKWLIAINKPSGLLSVPGRYLANQDSVMSRLQNLLPDGLEITAVHRLDWETSGILLLGKDQQTSSQLSQQFEKRQVHKVYEAVLSGTIAIDAGTIELPLWGNPENRPVQEVNLQCGKPSMTGFQVIGRQGNCDRIEFLPLTGRTHQLRVHAADVRGLGRPILGDRLYGCSADASRLHLHARELSFEHPVLGKKLHLQAETPF